MRHRVRVVDRVLRGDAFYRHGIAVHVYRRGERGVEVGWDTVVVGQSENGFDRRDVLFLSGDVALFDNLYGHF